MAERGAPNATDAPASAALLESLLLKDIIAWSQGLTPAQRGYVLTLDSSRLPPHFLTLPDEGGIGPTSGEIEQIRQRALRRANNYQTCI